MDGRRLDTLVPSPLRCAKRTSTKALPRKLASLQGRACEPGNHSISSQVYPFHHYFLLGSALPQHFLFLSSRPSPPVLARLRTARDPPVSIFFVHHLHSLHSQLWYTKIVLSLPTLQPLTLSQRTAGNMTCSPCEEVIHCGICFLPPFLIEVLVGKVV